MAPPRIKGTRIYARPSVRTGRSRYYYDTATQSFYNVPKRNVRSKRVDIRSLLSDPRTGKDFRLHKDGYYYFRGERINYSPSADTQPPRKLMRRTAKRPRARRVEPGEPTEGRLSGYPYFQRIRARNPGYRIVSLFERPDGVSAVFANDTGGSFIVTTDPQTAKQ